MIALALPAHGQTQESPAEAAPQSEYLQIDPLPPATDAPPAHVPSQPDAAVITLPLSQSQDRGVPSSGTPSIDIFLSKLDSATRAIHENAKKDPQTLPQGCRILLSEVLDLEAMIEAANTEIWNRMTPDQRASFRLAFERRMVGNCVRQFASYDGEDLQLAGVRTTQSGHLLATVRVGSRDDAKLVTWRLPSSSRGSWRAIDVITEGRSVVTDTRNEFESILRSVNGDIEALIAFMQK